MIINCQRNLSKTESNLKGCRRSWWNNDDIEILKFQMNMQKEKIIKQNKIIRELESEME